jgi:hypothetical protein
VPWCAVAALQTQEFYDFCDEHGIMVWQDAMFGGSHYPRNPEWLANIEEEITQQVRLQAPPCDYVCSPGLSKSLLSSCDPGRCN